ncbi:carboxylesterase/lipase family protein [Spirosoma sp. KUDC1026]|uniref:carboxylesterase/lipase family protein n=1 Tax=Spirosoma sp. KUDC1026 TaxID=2745947 RepID=UPI00159BB86C|nr:carboxylesterase family protein [Spirosoma sp. KUDC1026]
MFFKSSPTLRLFLASLFVSAVLAFTAAPDPSAPVPVTGGRVSGTLNKAGDIRIYRGIPFAAPPVGALRWKAPQPVKPWSGVRKCDAFGPSPMQGTPAPFSMWSEEFLIPKAPISEDCLYLNVWTGAKASTAKLPVVVWIYGGGFGSGGSAVPIYDGEATAQKGVIFVSINYRVGPFGFFAHPELTKESGHDASGNYGLLDQIAGLQWVKQNIAAFGGDPNNVTIAGQSAGSMSVNCLVASPLGKGLFNKAIAESGASFGRNYPSRQEAEENGLNVMKALGASSLAELRAKPADEILKKAQALRGPIIDGYVLPKSVSNIFADGQQNRVALLTGWNEDEGLLNGPIKNAADFRQQAEQRYGNQAAKFLILYPASTDAEANQSQMNLARDQIFGMPNYTWANIQSEQGQPTYVYRFTRKVPATGEYVKYGAFHTGEVPYAYGNLDFVNRPWESVDRELASTMSTYWVNFIKTGNPNGSSLPKWLLYTPKKKEIMVFGKTAQSAFLADSAALNMLYFFQR